MYIIIVINTFKKRKFMDITQIEIDLLQQRIERPVKQEESNLFKKWNRSWDKAHDGWQWG